MLQRKMTTVVLSMNYDPCQIMEPGGEVSRLLTVELHGYTPHLVCIVDENVKEIHESLIEIVCLDPGEVIPDTRYHYLGTTIFDGVGAKIWFGRYRLK